MNEQATNQLFVFKKVHASAPGERDRYELHKRIVLREIPEFKKVCMNFHFKKSAGPVKDTIIFTKVDQIFELNFETSALATVHEFKTPFGRQPLYFKPNEDQTIFLVASPDEGRHLHLASKKEIEFNADLQISSIKDIIYDEEERQFLILANKYEEKLGFFVAKMSEKDPGDVTFLIKWKNKLDIGDTKMFVLRNHEKGLKELIISFKTIFINTYNLVVLDISVEDDQLMIFRHESFQLWESECTGFLLSKNKDFITLAKAGMQVMSLGEVEKRALVDAQGFDRMLHSLESQNYLKVDKNNYLLLECGKPSQRIISIQQEYVKGDT